MITFMFLGFTCVVYVSHTANVLTQSLIIESGIPDIHIITYWFEIIRTLHQRGTCKETTRNAFKATDQDFFNPKLPVEREMLTPTALLLSALPLLDCL